jgi:hypothetical protein
MLKAKKQVFNGVKIIIKIQKLPVKASIANILKSILSNIVSLASNDITMHLKVLN